MMTREMEDYLIDEKCKQLYEEYWNDEYLNRVAIMDKCRQIIAEWDKGNMDSFEEKSADMYVLLHFMLLNDTTINGMNLISQSIHKYSKELEVHKAVQTAKKGE